MSIAITRKTVNEEIRSLAEHVLTDNGIEHDEAPTVLQALGYVLLDTELYPEKEASLPDSNNLTAPEEHPASNAQKEIRIKIFPDVGYDAYTITLPAEFVAELESLDEGAFIDAIDTWLRDHEVSVNYWTRI